MRLIEIDHVGKRIGKTIALDDVSFCVNAGSRLVLLGPSGAGKTTLLRILAGLETPDRGNIRFEGVSILSKPPSTRSVAMVSQDYALYPQLSVRGNLKTALKRARLDRESANRRIDETLQWFGIGSLADQLPSHLSGGEAQRAALSKAVVTRPKILLLDEPFSQVDGILKAPLTELLREIPGKYGCSTVMVTHDPLDAMKLADEIVMLDHGRILQSGLPAELYRSPATRVAAALLSPLGVNWFDLDNMDSSPFSKLQPARKQDSRHVSANRFVGFRPEDFVWSTAGENTARAPNSSAASFELEVTDVQNLGFAQLVLGDWQGHRLRLLQVAQAGEQSKTATGHVPSSKLLWVVE